MLTLHLFLVGDRSSDASRSSTNSIQRKFNGFRKSFKGSFKKGNRNLDNATISHLKGPTASEHNKMMSNFETAEYYSMLASAISGGVESPIQFVTQVRKSLIVYRLPKQIENWIRTNYI